MALFRFGSRSNQSKGVAAINFPIPEFGGDYIGDTALHTPDTAAANQYGWAQIYCLTATVLDVATKCNITGIQTVSLPAGTWVYGIFAQIKLTSGSIIAYKATD